MHQSHTAVIERNVVFDTDFATEPYEAGWAAEARWFVRVLDAAGDQPELEIVPQVSPDGLFWCDEGEPRFVACGPGLYTFAMRDFGAWLRLRGRVSGSSASFKLIIYLALKG